MLVSSTWSKLPPVLLTFMVMPFTEKLKIWQCSTCTAFPDVKLMPLRPSVVPAPFMERFLSVTIIVLGDPDALSLTLTPFTPLERIDPKPAPFVPSIVTDLVRVTAPKPPGSSASISPPAAVLEIAPANVLQGAVLLQGLTSSPTPETQVRVACAWAMEANESRKVAITRSLIVNRNSFIWSLLFSVELGDGRQLNADRSGHCCAESSHC